MLWADTTTLAELLHDALTYAHSSGGMNTRQGLSRRGGQRGILSTRPSNGMITR